MDERSSISKVAKRRRWREADGRAVVQAWRSSRLSVSEFARRLGVDEQRVRWWKGRLAGPEGEHPVRFHPVKVTQVSARAAIEIHVAGFRVVAGPGVAAEDLRSVLSAIRETAAC